MAVTDERVSHLEATMQKLAYEHMNTEIIVQNTSLDMEKFRKFVEKDIAEMRVQRADMNRKWGELANKMGTIVEDIVAPNIPTIAGNYFGVEGFTDFALNYKKRHSQKDRIKEFDAIAVSEKYFFLNETKSTPKQEYLTAFVEVQKEVFDYFPEYKGKILIPIFSSLNLPERGVAYLSRNSIYAMAMRGDSMDLLNYEEISRK